ncbi:uncharacterized protein YwqG [Nocardioides marinisabuli]|uniref:Uncharacterized protein YwqG n=1 Tax=Nocardioides marinisabuli TaxID=419476 RepID=A0A7Y9F3Q9_9ACTN|nr:DUF1963 domain-containing protein [Nocardioides marinisabuli]NYD58997.1 uncharacterized protein YwqG [Nocardioides marinisabuli]
MGYAEALDALVEAAPPGSGVRSLLRPCAAGLVSEDTERTGVLRRRTPVAPPVTGSYVGGHPFLPDDAEWPRDPDEWPMHFVLQVAFADVPALPGFPREGLLQMFVRDDSTHGLTFDDTAGTRGLLCRWYDAAALARPVEVTSTTPVFTSDDSPLADPQHPVALEFTSIWSLPLGWENLADDVAAAPEAFAALEELLETREDLVEALEQAVAEHGRWSGVHVGGWPSFVQGAPDVPAYGSSQLLVGMAGGLFEWGDVGNAHLFGDPEALAAGDVSRLWWEWAS